MSGSHMGHPGQENHKVDLATKRGIINESCRGRGPVAWSCDINLQQLHNDQQVHAIMYVIPASAGITVSVCSFGQASLNNQIMQSSSQDSVDARRVAMVCLGGD
jgi:hypothetical protein